MFLGGGGEVCGGLWYVGGVEKGWGKGGEGLGSKCLCVSV